MNENEQNTSTNPTVSTETMKGHWSDAFDSFLKQQYETSHYDKKPLQIDWWTIDKKNDVLAKYILDKPLFTLQNLQYVAHDRTNNGGFPINIHFNGDSVVQKEITKLRTKDLGKLRSLEGFIIQTSSPFSRIIQAAFRCKRCGHIVYLEQPRDMETLIEPFDCPQEGGGCGRTTSWEFLPDQSMHKDFQKILIQNPFYDRQRIELETHLYDDHVGSITCGEWVTFNGVYLLKNMKKQTPNPYFLVRGIEQSHARSLEFAEDERKLAEDIADDDQLWNKLISSFSPSVYGNNLLKEALLLQLFGGVWHDLPDGTTRRGSIHVLFAGDPGTAKSVFKQGSSNISPRFSSATGKGASVAGLTAGATKDKIGDREGWVLTAGALVLANGGVCYLDEFDKIPQEVHGSLHGPMEQGIVETSKMGAVNQRLPSRTAVFGAMNPKHGRFDNFDTSNYISQINLDAAMLSRFDLIFAVRDIVDEDKDRHISYHMHETLNGKCVEGLLDSDFLRKYVHHSHQINPGISREVYEYITELFVKVRVSQESDGVKLTNITFRQNDSLRRLAEASARSRLSGNVSVDDVDRAWRVFKGSLESLGVSDMDDFTVGWSDQARRVLREMEPVLPCSYQGLREMGFFEKDIELLKSKNVIFEKGGMFYRKKERL